MKLKKLAIGCSVCLLFTGVVGKLAAQSQEAELARDDSVSLASGVGVQETIPQVPSENERVDQLFSRWNNPTTPGASLAIVKDGTVVYKNGYGMANLEYDVLNSPSTVFHIASVSKQFTTFAILLLAEQGKLSLDDDIRKHIPEVPDFGKKITLRHLAHHTSGFRDQWALLQMAGWRLDDVITKEHVMKLVQKQRELNFDPGTEYLYCNTGYTLLAEVVARVSGKTFAEFTKQNIFEPLKMNDSLFYDDHEMLVPNRAYSYRPFGNRYKKSVLSYANVGATSLFTTAEDLCRWTMNFENPIVGSQKIFEQMNKRGVLNDGSEISYALGQVIGKYKGLNRIGHGGGDAGYRTYLVRFPDQHFSVVVLSNNGSFDPATMAYKVADIYLADEIAAVQGSDQSKKDSSKETEQPTKSAETFVAVDVKTLDEYTGKYELQPGVVIAVTQEDGKLFGQATGQAKTRLHATSATRFSVEGVDAKVSFHRDSNNKVNLLKLRQGDRTIEVPRQVQFDAKSVDLSQFAGTFDSRELSTRYEFVVEKSRLVIRHSRHPDIVARPIKKDLFQAGSRLGQIKFIRTESGVITGCRVSNGRVRNLLFEKASN